MCDPDMNPSEISEESIRQLFNAVTPGRGIGAGAPTVSARELKQVMISCGLPSLSQPQLRAIVAFFDRDQDGRLSYSDFQRTIRELGDLTEVDPPAVDHRSAHRSQDARARVGRIC